jgi:hypothetical protein
VLEPGHPCPALRQCPSGACGGGRMSNLRCCTRGTERRIEMATRRGGGRAMTVGIEF